MLASGLYYFAFYRGGDSVVQRLVTTVSEDQSTPEAAINRMIQLLESKQFERFFAECVSPFERKKIEKRQLSKVLEEFKREEKDQKLLDILLRIRDQRVTPVINPMDNTAHYWINLQPTITLSNINGKWYLENQKD